ncbi:MAG: S1 RNA-binding domain-containing protein [Candidatus Gastranaerophilales bacterium]|nr:S1 RNA-binding domain-containing protein [Candidatus Gastranaerophilales bacterium]
MSKEVMTDDEFEALLAKYDYGFQKGDLVKGIVCGYDNTGVTVDIGAKTAAFVPIKEARLDNNTPVEEILKKNESYEFLIIKEEDEDGKFLLSYKRVATAYSWRELEDKKAADEVVEGVITGMVKGGVLVEVNGVKGFVPSSHLRVKTTEDMIGSKIELKILSMDAQLGNFILSNKKVYSEDREETRRDTFSKIVVGERIKGEVVRITDFGAFVNIGGVDGLLPLSQISWKWIDHPSDILNINDTIEVEIIGIDYDKQRVSLSLKNLEVDPWIAAKEKIHEGDEIEGVITRIKHFGAFVEVIDGVEALLPSSDLAEWQAKNNKTLEVGDKVQTTILKFNPDDRRISLSIKEVQ